MSQFPHDLTPGPGGHWTGRLTTGRWVGVVATLVLESVVLAVAVLVVVEALAR